MITTTQNRNISFIAISDKLPKKRKHVYEIIKALGVTSPQEICDKYSFQFNEIAPRFTELRNSAHIKIVGYKKNKRSKHPNAIYRITTADEMIEIKNKKY